jgi:hypothetical protein
VVVRRCRKGSRQGYRQRIAAQYHEGYATRSPACGASICLSGSIEAKRKHAAQMVLERNIKDVLESPGVHRIGFHGAAATKSISASRTAHCVGS